MKKIFLSVFVITLAIFLVSCKDPNEKPQNFDQSFAAMATEITLRIESVDEKINDAESVFLEIKNLFDHIHSLSDKEKNHEGVKNVMYINRHPETKIEIDKDLYLMLELSENVKEQTNGYFDISIGKIIDKWKDLIGLEVPLSENELEDYIKNIKEIPVIENGISLTSQDEKYFVEIKQGVEIDLGSVAKGYAVNEANKLMKEKGFTYYQILGSGSSLYYGKNSKREGNYFVIGLGRPRDSEGRSYFGAAKVLETSLTTSGDAEQYVYYGDKKYHHVVSPVTKTPENYRSLVFVMHDDAAYADALTTALINMPTKELEAWLENNPSIKVIIYNFDDTFDYSHFPREFYMTEDELFG